MIEEILEDSSEIQDPTLTISLTEAINVLPPTQIIVLWYWLLGFTQEEIRFKIYPGRSRAYVWQTKNKALRTLKETLLIDL